jgi:hypothetical protein
MCVRHSNGYTCTHDAADFVLRIFALCTVWHNARKAGDRYI